jgi:hypothetical protein
MDRMFKYCFQFPDEIDNAAIRFAQVILSTQLQVLPNSFTD